MRSPFISTCHMTCDFKKKGNWAAGYHTGEDWVYNNKNNTALVSPVTGIILKNDYSPSYGNYIVIQARDEDFVILMAHMKNKSPLIAGTKVLESQKVGVIGETGNASGVHLHIEVEEGPTWSYNRNLIRPSDVIRFQQFSSNFFSDPKGWKNGSTKEFVYSSTTDCLNKKNSIGFLFPYEHATCFGVVDGCYLINYTINNYKHKAGFVSSAGGIK